MPRMWRRVVLICYVLSVLELLGMLRMRMPYARSWVALICYLPSVARACPCMLLHAQVLVPAAVRRQPHQEHYLGGLGHVPAGAGLRGPTNSTTQLERDRAWENRIRGLN